MPDKRSKHFCVTDGEQLIHYRNTVIKCSVVFCPLYGKMQPVVNVYAVGIPIFVGNTWGKEQGMTGRNLGKNAVDAELTGGMNDQDKIK